MKKILIILFLLLIAYQIVAQKHKISNNVLYFPDYDDVLGRTGNGYIVYNKSIRFQTYRNYHSFIDTYIKEFGNKYSSTFPDNNTEEYLWKNIHAIGFKNMEIGIKVIRNYHLGNYDVMTGFYNDTEFVLNNTHSVMKFIEKAFNSVQSTPLTFEKKNTYSLSFEFGDIFSVNLDSLVACYRNDFSLENKNVTIKIEVDKKGKITQNSIEAPPVILSELVDLLSNLQFPVAVFQNSLDSANYTISYHAKIPTERFEQLSLEEIKNDYKTNQLEINHIIEDSIYQNGIMIGDLFGNAKTICMLPDFNSPNLYFYEIVNNQFIPIGHLVKNIYDWKNTLKFVDLNNDGLKEIVAYDGNPSEFGYQNCNVYSYNPKSNTVVLAAWLNSRFTFDKEKKEVIDVMKILSADNEYDWVLKTTKYVWYHHRLIIKNTIHYSGTELNDKSIVSYYENTDYQNGNENLKLIKKCWSSDKKSLNIIEKKFNE